jgi:hypothetical protein
VGAECLKVRAYPGERSQVSQFLTIMDRAQICGQISRESAKAGFQHRKDDILLGFGQQLLQHWGFNHHFAASEDGEEFRIIIPQSHQNLGHGEQIVMQLRGRELIDPVSALLKHNFGIDEVIGL